MLAVPVFNMSGKQSGEIEIDPSALGGRVRPRLIKQAVVTFLNHQWQRSARTKRRSDVVGSTRKIYRQKGTGNARAGTIRTPVRRGGGRTFGKRIPASVKELPKKMRRLARNSAILAKIEANEVLVLDGFTCNEPKTKAFATMLNALGADSGCVFAMHEANRDAYLSGRNVPKTDVRLVGDLSAYEVLRRKKVVFTKPAFEQLMTSGEAGAES